VATEETGMPLGLTVVGEELEVGVVGTHTDMGYAVLPVFTTEARLVDWMPEGSPYVGLHGQDMLALFLKGPWEAVVVDPTERRSRTVSRATDGTGSNIKAVLRRVAASAGVR